MTAEASGAAEVRSTMEFISPEPLEICQTVEPWAHPGTRVVVGNSYLLEVTKVRAEAAQAGLHVDAWLLRRVARFFFEHQPTHPCALFLGAGADQLREFFRLTLSERSGVLTGAWLADIPGFFELGAESVPPTSRLWAVWRDNSLTRVHDFLEARPSGLMVADIGGYPGITFFTDVPEDEYDDLAGDPIERWDCSPIPRSFVEQVEVGSGVVMQIRHVAYNSMPVGDGEEWDEDLQDDGEPVAASVDVDELIRRMGSRATRAAAIVEACECRATACIPAIVAVLDQLAWAEVETVREALPLLAPAITGPLLGLLDSERKQTAEVVTTALGRIGDPVSSGSLLGMMEQQVGTANAIRARDALIAIGEGAVRPLILGLYSAQWETRMHVAQALGAIGSRVSLNDLRGVAERDRSAKVRDAAAEAASVIESGEGE